MSPLATLVDTDALWHVALYAFVASSGLVLSYGTAILSLDRIEVAREEGGGTPPAWVVALFCSAVIGVGIIVLGIWAMLQKS